MSNLDRYKKDLKSLIATGEQLLNAINAEFFPDQFEAETKKKIGAKKAKEFIAALPSFAKKKFLRGAGATAGVVLEKHLRQVCSNH